MPTLFRLLLTRTVAAGALVGVSQLAAGELQSREKVSVDQGATLISNLAPKGLSEVLVRRTPLEISLNGRSLPIELKPSAPGRLEGVVDGGLGVEIDYEYLAEVRVLRWTTRLRNRTPHPIENVEVTPLVIPMDIVPDRDHPRVRHLTGSFHLDAAYPPRAFRVQEERIMTHTRAKPIWIGSGSGPSTRDHSPELQLQSVAPET